MSLLLILIACQRPAQAHAAQETPLPDLVVRNIQSIEDYKVVAIVANFGKAPSGICVVTLEIIDAGNPQQVLFKTEVAVTPLEPGKFFVATFNTSPHKAKGNRLQLVADASGRVRESNENNNRLLDVSTVNKPSPAAVNTFGGLPKNSPPDLLIKDIAGTPTTKRALRVQVANMGGSETSQPCRLMIQIFSTNDFKDSEIVETKEIEVPALKSGETKWLLLEVDKEFEQSDNHNHVTPLMAFRLTIDSKNVVAESNKNNNRNQYHAPPPKTNGKP